MTDNIADRVPVRRLSRESHACMTADTVILDVVYLMTRK